MMTITKHRLLVHTQLGVYLSEHRECVSSMSINHLVVFNFTGVVHTVVLYPELRRSFSVTYPLTKKHSGRGYTDYFNDLHRYSSDMPSSTVLHNMHT